MRLTTCSTIFSALLFGSCASYRSRTLPPRPDTYICVVNAQAKNKKCFNMQADYDSDGNLKSNAVPYYKPLETLEDLDKTISIDSTPDFLNFKIWINLLKEKIKN